MSIALAGQNLILVDLGYTYEGVTSSTLFLFHGTAFSLSYEPEDLTDKSSSAMSFDLARQNLILEDLGYTCEGNTASNMFLHETAFPLSYGFEDLTDKSSFSM